MAFIHCLISKNVIPRTFFVHCIFGDDENLWGDEEDSGWESESNIEIEEEIKNRLLEIGLSWKQNTHLEKKIRGPYLTKKTPKSTYYNKYDPNGTWTKTSKGTSKIT